MKFKKILPIFGLCLSTFAAIGASAFAHEEKPLVVDAASSYYDDISTTASGEELLSQLKTLNLSKRTRSISYNSMTSYFGRTDPYPGGGVTAYYSGRRVNKVNREHVWPFSRIKLTYEEDTRGKYDIENDIHMIRPAEASDNEQRGNKFYGTPNDDNYWDPGCLGDESYRGDAARIIFYSMTACADVDLKLSENTEGILQHSMGRLSYLLEWNIKYPVTQKEKTRNEAAQSLQGNRNAFIDNPGYACRIWGNTNDLTRAICSKDPYNHDPSEIVDVAGVSLDKDFVMLEKGQSEPVSVSVSPANASDKYVTWSSSNNLVAYYSGGAVKTVLNNGVSTLTATTHDGGFTANVDVVVADTIVHAQSVHYEVDSIDVQMGEDKNMLPTFSPSNSTYKGCSFTISDPSVCEISKDGTLTTKKQGKVTVTAKSRDGGFEDSVELNVLAGKATSVTINQMQSEIKVGDTLQLELIFTPQGSYLPVIWASSQPAVATVDANGKVTAVAEGRTFISIKDESGNLLSTAVVDVVGKAKTASGCGGNITTASVLLSVLAGIGISLLLVKRKRKEA